jgi:hypothetical protein
MAATVYLSESNGVGPTVTDNIGNINFGSADIPNLVPSQHKILTGPGLSQRSYIKWLRIKLHSLGGAASVKNFRTWHVSGGLGANRLKSGDYSGANQFVNYSGPTTGIINSIPGYSVAFMLESTPSFNTIDIAGTLTGSLTIPGTYSNYWLMQIASIEDNTPSGLVLHMVIRIQWDET